MIASRIRAVRIRAKRIKAKRICGDAPAGTPVVENQLFFGPDPLFLGSDALVYEA